MDHYFSKYSDFGKIVSEFNEIGLLILNVQKAKQEANNPQDIIDLSSGNPKIFPEVIKIWDKCIKKVGPTLGAQLSQYGEVFGYSGFLDELVKLFKQYDLNLTRENFLISNGAQIAVFYILNLFSGLSGNRKLKILLPQCPEYRGYKNLGSLQELFITAKSHIEIIDDHVFRYRVNVDELEFIDDVNAILLSRPCNPSGNILPEEDFRKLVAKAREKNILVIADCAYSLPIPNLIYKDEHKILFADNLLQVFSFSKAGLADGRLGIIVGNKDILKSIRLFQMNACITVGTFSQMVVAHALETGDLIKELKTTVRPFYQNQIALIKKLFEKYMNGNVPYYLHQADGGIFQWVWFKDLPIKDGELFEILRKENVFITPGNMFFYGLKDQSWQHMHECVRISLIETEERIAEGIRKLSVVINNLYK